ncbi:MAG: hypothetical protein ABSF50_09220 [Burkholderiaceae bacterium]|jgi:hypothetical protein
MMETKAVPQHVVGQKTRAEPHPVGAILRYGPGPTALFQVSHVTVSEQGEIKYFGEHCMGGLYCANHRETRLASARDLQTWAQQACWRSTAASDSDELFEETFLGQ